MNNTVLKIFEQISKLDKNNKEDLFLMLYKSSILSKEILLNIKDRGNSVRYEITNEDIEYINNPKITIFSTSFLHKLFNIPTPNLRYIFNIPKKNKEVSRKDLEIILFQLELHLFPISKLPIDKLQLLVEYISYFNKSIKIDNTIKGKTSFYNIKNRILFTLIKNGYLSQYHIEYLEDDNSKQFAALTFQIEDKYFQFHQPLFVYDNIKELLEINENKIKGVYIPEMYQLEIDKEKISKLKTLWRFLSNIAIF